MTLPISFNSNFAGAKTTYMSASETGTSTGWVARGSYTVLAPLQPKPSADSASPSSGSGSNQTFSFAFSDAVNATNLTNLAVQINSSIANNNTCYIVYDRATNLIRLVHDNIATGSDSMTPGTANTLQNSQCIVSGIGSSVSISGDSMILTVAITFQAAFAGQKTIYMCAAEPNLNTGWVVRGGWTAVAPLLPPPKPSVVSVSPSSGSGSNPTFTFTFSDAANAANLADVAVLIAPAITSDHVCYIVYDQPSNRITLVRDLLSSGSDSMTPGSPTVLQNSQCKITGTTTSVSISGTTLTLAIPITFRNYSGSQNIYMQAAEVNANTGWVQKGTWTAVGGAPQATLGSVNPSSGSGSSQTFTFTFSDAVSATNLADVAVMIAPAVANDNVCWIVYDQPSNRITLVRDLLSSGSDAMTPGAGAVLQNSQCKVSGTGSSVSISGTTLTLTLPITFRGGLSGNQNIYMMAAETSMNTGWAQKGTWNVTSGGQPQPSLGPVNPSSGSGSSQTFTFTFLDAVSAINLADVAIMIAPSVANDHVCWIVYDQPGNRITLVRDLLNSGSDSMAPGSTSVLQNSQCKITGAGSLVSVSGTTLTLTLPITFSSGYSGNQNIYTEAAETNINTGWSQKGSWTVN